jgi:hypothetical protein
VTHHLQRTDFGRSWLGTPSLQKRKLLNPLLALPLSFIPPPVGVGYHTKQILEAHLSYISSLSCNHELTL